MSKNSCHSDSSQAHIFLNCAAPKAKIAQNCHLIRQIQNDYPPYPSGVGLYGGETAIAEYSKPIPPPRPSNLSVTVEVPPDKLKKHPGILKNYKSCPVSPVHEELEWAVVQNRATKIKFNESTNSKRHTMYSDDARTILDMIHVDTEKMIAEITQKYGDLNDRDLDVNMTESDIEQNKKLKGNKYTAKKDKHEHDFLSDEEINFSSDSLEDCSLDLDYDQENLTKKKKTLCKKLHRKYEPVPPKRSISEYFIYEDNFTFANSNRKVSLSDILNEDDNVQHRFLETQRHSSASFFLGQQYDRKSQESILSDDFSAGAAGVSFCNSMESILSDESDCKSAPLEILFEKGKMGQRNIGVLGQVVDSNSKSYGSSPNSNIGLDYFMQHDDKCDISNYGIESKSFRVLGAVKSPTHHPNHHRLVCNSLSFPQFENISLNDDCSDDFIPSLTSKAAQYSTNLNKSLSKDFANQRKSLNSNPLHGCDELFMKKLLPEQCFNRSDIFSDAIASSSTYALKKSCSFEVEMGTCKKVSNNTKKFEQNLQRFEKDRKEQHDQHLQLQKSDFNLEMDYVPHKPPAHRRSSSMKGRGKLKCKERFSTVGQITSSKTVMSFSHGTEIRNFVNKDLLGKVSGKRYSSGEERSFEGYIAEKGVNEDDNMDSLEFIGKRCDQGASIDSPDKEIESTNTRKSEIDMLVDSRYITSAEYTKFRDIEKKIDIINKLVEMEERKLEQERIIKENRMKPLFDGDTTQRGFVRNLTKNFDMLTKSSQNEVKVYKSCTTCKIKRNYSLPDVLEGAKYQTFEFYDEDMNYEAHISCNESNYDERVLRDQLSGEGVTQHQISIYNNAACLFACFNFACYSIVF